MTGNRDALPLTLLVGNPGAHGIKQVDICPVARIGEIITPIDLINLSVWDADGIFPVLYADNEREAKTTQRSDGALGGG